LNEKIVEKLKEKLGIIERYSNEMRFKPCKNISTDIIRASEFMGCPEGIFIGEFFEALFINLYNLMDIFEISEEYIEPLNKEIAELIEFLIKSLPANDANTKSEIFDKMVRVRSIVTELQIKAFREEKFERKKETLRTSPLQE